MRELKVEQGSPEWFRARLGRCTGSNFDKLMTKTGKFSAQSKAYADELIAEMVTGHKQEFSDFKSDAMIRGNDLEEFAVSTYERVSGEKTTVVGMVVSACGRFSVSPDRYVGDKGLVEIKCPLQKKHINTLIYQKMDMTYYAQVQSQLLITGREWCDFMSFHPEMPPLIERVYVDDEYRENLLDAMAQFIEDMDEKINRLKELGVEFNVTLEELKGLKDAA